MAPTCCSLNNCIICDDLLLDDACCLSCGHVFHSACIRDWYKIKQHCPICEKRVSVHGIKKLYFTREEGECQCSTDIIQAQKSEIELLKMTVFGSEILIATLRSQIEAFETERQLKQLMDLLQSKGTQIDSGK